MLWSWCVLYILACKCASRHNGVHFFDIATSKRAPKLKCGLRILTWKCASRHNGVQLFISHLTTWFHRFSEPTFRPSGATNHWQNTVFPDFSTFLHNYIFFLLTLSLLWSSLFFLSPLWLFPPLLFHLSILSEVWLLLNFLRTGLLAIRLSSLPSKLAPMSYSRRLTLKEIIQETCSKSAQCPQKCFCHALEH